MAHQQRAIFALLSVTHGYPGGQIVAMDGYHWRLRLRLYPFRQFGWPRKAYFAFRLLPVSVGDFLAPSMGHYIVHRLPGASGESSMLYS